MHYTGKGKLAFSPCKWHLVGSMENDMNGYEKQDIEMKVVAMHSAGRTPSEIDERMYLEPGTAHDIMVARWKFDKEARLRHV